MNILCIAAHQDDIELNCLGTMIKYRREGHNVTHLVLTNGDKGGQFDLSIPYEEVARIRDREAGALADKLGARYICLHENDEYLKDTDELRDRVTDVIREVKADVVFTAPPSDYNLDHTETSRIAFQTVMFSMFKTIKTQHHPLDVMPAFFYMEPIACADWIPTHYVDISDVFAEKCELLKFHDSQMKNMTTSSGWDLIEYATIVNRYRGVLCGVQYAESFLISTTWPRMTARNNLLP